MTKHSQPHWNPTLNPFWVDGNKGSKETRKGVVKPIEIVKIATGFPSNVCNSNNDTILAFQE
jgi:hypothetical protein